MQNFSIYRETVSTTMLSGIKLKADCWEVLQFLPPYRKGLYGLWLLAAMPGSLHTSSVPGIFLMAESI